MLCRSAARRVELLGENGIANKIVPGYQAMLWKKYPDGLKSYYVKSENDSIEAGLKKHKQWQGVLTSWKNVEASYVPSFKYRKPSVDWRRQLARGTVHTGRWYEGPPVEGSKIPSDYTPGNTRNRMDDIYAPFTDAEWEQRKQYRSFDLVHFAYGGLGLFLAYRALGEWPVVWC